MTSNFDANQVENGSHKLRMTRALNHLGEMVSIECVEKGEACNCACPVCRNVLIAKKGEHNAHHFAHKTSCECGWTGESELHILAKEVLMLDKEVSFTAKSQFASETVSLEFDIVESEKSLSVFKPDLTCITQEGERVYIEICVTHKCTDEKIRYFKSNRLNAIEILLPPKILDGLEIIDIEIVRSAIKSAEIRVISLDPFSVFCSPLATIFDRNVSQFQKSINEKEKAILKLQSEMTMLKQENIALSEINLDLKSRKLEVDNEIELYYQQVLKVIDPNGLVDVYKYEKSRSKYIDLTAEAREKHEKELETMKRQYNQCHAELQRDLKIALKGAETYRKKRLEEIQTECVSYENQLKNRFNLFSIQRAAEEAREEVQRLKVIVDEMRKSESVRLVDDHIKLLNERYHNYYLDLKEYWERFSKWYRDATIPTVLLSDFSLPSDAIIKKDEWSE